MCIVKMLVCLTDNPNASDENGSTPIYWAAMRGHIEIVKIMAPLTDNPNAPNNNGAISIDWATYIRYAEMVKILVSLPNCVAK